MKKTIVFFLLFVILGSSIFYFKNLLPQPKEAVVCDSLPESHCYLYRCKTGTIKVDGIPNYATCSDRSQVEKLQEIVQPVRD